MELNRSILGIGPKAPVKVARGGSDDPKWAVTLTGPVKGMAPVTITVQAASGKAACAGLKALFLVGRLKVERV